MVTLYNTCDTVEPQAWAATDILRNAVNVIAKTGHSTLEQKNVFLAVDGKGH